MHSELESKPWLPPLRFLRIAGQNAAVASASFLTTSPDFPGLLSGLEVLVTRKSAGNTGWGGGGGGGAVPQ